MADVTYYVALPFLQDDDGSPVAGAAEECQSPTTALRRAEVLSRSVGSIGAVAFSRTGDPMPALRVKGQAFRRLFALPEFLSDQLKEDAACRFSSAITMSIKPSRR